MAIHFKTMTKGATEIQAPEIMKILQGDVVEMAYPEKVASQGMTVFPWPAQNHVDQIEFIGQ